MALLMAAQPILLAASTVVTHEPSSGCDVVFCSDAEAGGWPPTTALTWSSFLERMVPGHG